MSFKIGQKVVCIEDFSRKTGKPDGSNLRESQWWEWFPTKGEVYTISEIHPDGHIKLREAESYSFFDKRKFRSLEDYEFAHDVLTRISKYPLIETDD